MNKTLLTLTKEQAEQEFKNMVLTHFLHEEIDSATLQELQLILHQPTDQELDHASQIYAIGNAMYNLKTNPISYQEFNQIFKDFQEKYPHTMDLISLDIWG